MDRELRHEQDARDRKQRAMDLEIERERRFDVRESRLFDQFRDYLDITRSDLKDAVLVRERAARLQLQLKHSEENAAAAAAAAAERSRVAHDVIQPITGTSIEPAQPAHSFIALSDVVDACYQSYVWYNCAEKLFFNGK